MLFYYFELVCYLQYAMHGKFRFNAKWNEYKQNSKHFSDIPIYLFLNKNKQVRKNLDGEPVYKGLWRRLLKTSLEGNLFLQKGQQIEGFWSREYGINYIHVCSIEIFPFPLYITLENCKNNF